MARHQDDWGLGDFFAWAHHARGGRVRGEWTGRANWWRRAPMFESGEVKFVILRLLKEKPRHGYQIIKALEEKMGGCYAPSPGTIYPTLQLLEDEGYVRGVETEGKKVYHLTPDGDRFLAEHRDVLEDILERVRDTLHDFAGGAMGELNAAFARLTTATYKRAWRKGPEHPAIARVTEILRKAADEVERAWEGPDNQDPGARS